MSPSTQSRDTREWFRWRNMAMTRSNLAGEKFGRLTAIEAATGGSNGECVRWRCECECGNSILVRSGHLKSGSTNSCGCSRSKDILGKRFGKIQVIERIIKNDNYDPEGVQWKCRCDCGREFVRNTKALLSDGRRSCIKCSGVEHGMSKHYAFKAAENAISRCHNLNDKQYKNYGARGISVHEPWRTRASVFAEWLLENLGERPSGYSLDRIDVNQGYEPGNLRWADRKVQGKNKRKIVCFDHIREAYQLFQDGLSLEEACKSMKIAIPQPEQITQ